MKGNSIILLISKIQKIYTKEIDTYLNSTKKQRTYKFYKLIVSAKNDEQLEKSLLFRKLFNKTYSEKLDYLWRNEIRILKEELEKFLITIEHQHISNHNNAYNDWLLVQAFNRLQYIDGIDEKTEKLVKQKDNYASYNFALDACFIRVENVRYKITDISKRLQTYPSLFQDCTILLDDLISAKCAELNLYKAQSNWISYNHHQEHRESLVDEDYICKLRKNALSNLYNHFAASYTVHDNNDNKIQIKNLDQALEFIESIYQNNTLFQEVRINILIAKGRELSANGFFKDSDIVLKSIKQDIDKQFKHHGIRTIYYVNYITNLVKCKYYDEVLNVLDNDFSTDNMLYKNMLLYNRLLCYLYLRDTQNLSNYISYDLDAAPFPQNYMLKIIKSVYFYLIREYDTAIIIINSLAQSVSSEKMLHYKNICQLFKKLYTVNQKYELQKQIPSKEIRQIQEAIEEFENVTPNEFKLVSVYLWLKEEVTRIL